MAAAPGTGGSLGSLRVLVLSNMFPSEGNEVFGIFIARQTRALAERGAWVKIVASPESRGGWRNAFKYGSLYFRAGVAALLGRYDVVVGHYLYPTAAIAQFAANFARVPYVLVAHGTDVTSLASRNDALSRASLAALHDADAVVAVSSALRERLHNELSLPESVETRVVHMGVDTEIFRPDPEARTRLGWSIEERVVLFVGNLVETKGPDLALAAFEKLVATGAADRLVMVGEGPLRHSLEETIGDTGMRDRVTLTGQLGAPEVALYQAAADVLLMPSRNEGLGLAALEALASGTPVVATRVGGVPEVVPESGCGELVEPGSVGALAEAVTRVLGEGKEPYSGACIQASYDNDIRSKADEFMTVLWGVTSR